MPRASLAAALLLAVAGPAWPADPPIDAFVKALVAAINAKDDAGRRALLHPDSLKCATPGKDEVLDKEFARQARDPIAGEIGWRLTPAPPGRPMFADRFDYPVRPTHLLRLDFSAGENRPRTLVLQLARVGDAWREVAGCPKP